ncbi:MAG: nucleotidyltransferase substrate binding protein [Candidatus Liptonbacteria bacterium]|nr:nucleotidyltransferase substrate binding protein [Candidatus Liptonbacteria bacterium]
MTKDSALTEDFENALERFREALSAPATELHRDATIQRFEFCFDLAWKLIKEVLETKRGVVCNSPKTCLREAYKQKFIEEYDKRWLAIADDRNLTAHTYNEALAKEIYERLPKALELFNKLRDTLSASE